MKDGTRRGFIALALVVVAAAAYYAPAVQTPVAAPAQRRSEVAVVEAARASTVATSEATEMSVAAIRPRNEVLAPSDGVFGLPIVPEAARPVPSAPVPSTPQSVPPEPPPVALKVMGQFAEGGQPGLFVEYKEQSMLVRVGDTVGGLYRIESIQEGRLTMRYLPLDRQQTVDLNETGSR